MYKSGTSVGISGATVSLSPGGYSDTTDYNGYYSLNVPGGIYSATISASGYLTTSTEVSISADRRQDFYLTRFSPPSEPLNLQATAGDNKVTLDWTAPSDSGGWAITNYKIYRGTTPGGETLLATIGNVLSYADTTVTNDVKYYYQVSAVNSVGEGPRSTEVSATPVVPEFPSFLILPLFMITTLLAVIFYRRKHSK